MAGIRLSGAMDSVGRGRQARKYVHLNELLPSTRTLNRLAQRVFWLKLLLGPLLKCGLPPSLAIWRPR